MVLFILLFALISLSLVILRSLRDRWLKRQLPRWTVSIGGPVAWILVVSGGIWVIQSARLMIQGALGDVDALLTAIAAILLAGLGATLGMVAGADPVKDFLVESLLFRDYERSMEPFAAEEAQRAMDDHHRAMGEEENAKRLLGQSPPKPQDPEKLRSELEAIPPVVRSPDLARELTLLEKGLSVNLTDSWRLFWYTQDIGEPADEIIMLELDPTTGELSVHQVREDLSEVNTRLTLRSVRLRQDLYDLMVIVWNSQWITPYASAVRTLAVIAYGTTVDTFGGAAARPVVRSYLPIGYLQKSEHGMRDIRDLPLELLGPDPP